ncbi:MAG TPA: LptE family protein [Bacteroidales bacterium]|nr:LptE family protein [Bacteroidales bacterium]
MRIRGLQLMLLVGLLLSCTQCTIQYSMGGANIQPDVTTLTIQDFPNRAPSGPANMGQFFTNELKDRFQSQTNLTFVNERGDLTFSGGITSFETRPVSVGGEQTANETRLTIRVHVKFTNRKYPENSYETDFSQYSDFPANRSLSDVETEKMEEITEKLIDDIFRKAVVNW